MSVVMIAIACGIVAVLYGLMLLLLGIPAFVWQRHRALGAAKS